MNIYVEKAILDAQKKYAPAQLVRIDSKIRELAENHYKYGASMPLCYGKARGIRNILSTFYDVDVSIYYVWDVLEEYANESNE